MLNLPTQTLVSLAHKFSTQQTSGEGQDRLFKVSRAISAAAFWYEKLRTAMEYREDHLIRRSAIYRILTRRLVQTKKTNELAEYLLKELVWARYLPDSYATEETLQNVTVVLGTYKTVVSSTPAAAHGWLWTLASSEIEKVLAEKFWNIQEALANYVYYFMAEQVTPENPAEEKLFRVQLYLAVWRSFVRADNELLSYQLFRQKLPSWPKTDGVDFLVLQGEIDKEISSPVAERLQRIVERKLPPFLVLQDLFKEKPREVAAILENPEEFEKTVYDLCQNKYLSTKERVSRAITRSIIYIFLTKMVLALILEIPVDKMLYGEISYFTIAINSIFPPILMYFLSLTIQIPTKDNTRRVWTLLSKIVYHDPSELAKSKVRLLSTKDTRVLTQVFNLLYAVAFIISFGFIFWVLSLLGINLLGKAIFLFFLSVVSFFTYRIRRTAHQYLLDEKEGLFSPLTDFFLVPILRVGRILSSGLAQLNLLMFILDLAFEAPFKIIFGLTEEWAAFIRSKKDEIV